MLDIMNLTQNYRVESMTNHLGALAGIYQENAQYFQAMGKEVPTENLWEDLVAVPEGKSVVDKCFLGFWEGEKLVAVLEMLADYPGENVIYIGLFMLAADRQGKGEGGRIMEEVFTWLKSDGYGWVSLDYTYGNQQSEAFWKKLGFRGNGDVRAIGNYAAIGMERKL